ncbi:MAG TPA: hypothetical protein VFI25_15360 [Planctomycetota bacterium]|nr:hypothetical protein [Planctomycetota bacterium]
MRLVEAEPNELLDEAPRDRLLRRPAVRDGDGDPDERVGVLRVELVLGNLTTPGG